MGGVSAAAQKLLDKTYDTMNRIHMTLIPRAIVTSERTNVVLENTNKLIEEAGTNIANASASVVNIAAKGAKVAAVKLCADFGLSCYQTIRMTGIASDARNDLKKLADNTIKTENEIVNVLKNTSNDLGSSVGQFTQDAHKMGQNLGLMSAEISGAANQASQNFGHMAESLSQSSAEISSATNQASRNFGYMTHVTSDFLAYFSQDIHQTSRSFRVTCFSLTTFALVATMNSVASLQNSSCDRDPESMLCTAPLKSMAAAAIATGFLAIRMLMPNRVQNQVHQNSEILASNETISVMDLPDQVLKECLDLNFLIPEGGIDQNIEWTQEELNSIKATSFAVFNFIEIKRQVGSKWHKQELKWLLNQNENIFLKVLLGRAYTNIDHLDQVLLEETIALSFLIPEKGINQNIEWTQEELDLIKTKNFDIFSFFEMKRQLGGKWNKQDLEWLLSQDKNIFLKVILREAYTTSNYLDNNN